MIEVGKDAFITNNNKLINNRCIPVYKIPSQSQKKIDVLLKKVY